MGQQTDNRFQDFFEEDKYIFLKNELYNYLLRKRAVEKYIQSQAVELALEVGSGISPVMTKTSRIIYSDLSLTALQILKRTLTSGSFIVADGMNLPFKSGVFRAVMISYALHEKTQGMRSLMLDEARRVLDPCRGRLIVIDFEVPWDRVSRLGRMFTYLIERLAGGDHFLEPSARRTLQGSADRPGHPGRLRLRRHRRYGIQGNAADSGPVWPAFATIRPRHGSRRSRGRTTRIRSAGRLLATQPDNGPDRFSVVPAMQSHTAPYLAGGSGVHDRLCGRRGVVVLGHG